jgi:hypothetical protein
MEPFFAQQLLPQPARLGSREFKSESKQSLLAERTYYTQAHAITGLEVMQLKSWHDAIYAKRLLHYI